MVWVRGVTSAWVMSATLWVVTLWVMSVAMRAVMQISLPQPRQRWETLTATTRQEGNVKSQNDANIITSASAARRARRKERQQQTETKSCSSKEL